MSGGTGDARRVGLPAPAGWYVDAMLRADGALVFEAQILRPGLPEYEYVVTLPADQVPALRDALAVPAEGDLTAELVRRGEEITPHLHAWLRELGLRPELWTHLGD
ncbi:hypothetical protein [Streptacidiphilus pinicola]|nr:hypothetical protein [Streptacidiphilus pinicola]